MKRIFSCLREPNEITWQKYWAWWQGSRKTNVQNNSQEIFFSVTSLKFIFHLLDAFFSFVFSSSYAWSAATSRKASANCLAIKANLRLITWTLKLVFQVEFYHYESKRLWHINTWYNNFRANKNGTKECIERIHFGITRALQAQKVDSGKNWDKDITHTHTANKWISDSFIATLTLFLQFLSSTIAT